jgi:hypothetical protein
MRKLAFIAALAFLINACGPQKEKAGDNDYSTATPIHAGKVQGHVETANDIDFYKIDVAQDAVLSAHVGGIRDVDFVMSVRDKDHRELMRVDETGIGGDEEVLDVGVKPPGPYYIVLSNKNPAANNPSQPYLMEVKLEKSIGRGQKPDGTPQTASTLVVPGVTRAHYWPIANLLASDTGYAQQEDWYRIDISTGLFLLNIDLSGVSKVDPIMEIYDVNGYKVKEVDSGGVGEGESLKNFGVRGPVQYNLRLRAKNRSGNPDQPYEILTELIPYQGTQEFEPNDQRADATPFEGESITGTIAPEGDVDWYKVTVKDDGKQILRASVTGVDGLDLVMALCDSLGQPLTVVDNMGKGQPEVMTGFGVTKGDYYLVVSEKSGRRANANQTYTLTKTLAPAQAGLEYESNESTGTAQPLKVGESIDGYLAPKGDVDWYQFNVYQKGGVLFELAGVPNVQFVATLYDQDYKELQNWTAPKIGESLSAEKDLDPGTYFLRLKGFDASQNNVRDKYSLRLKAR